MKTLVKSGILASATVSLILSNGMPAVAASLTLNSVTGRWTNPLGGGATVTGVNTNQIRWGTPVNVEKSGLGFIGSAPPSASITTETNFVLGTLTHYNFPVFPPSVSAVDLGVTLDIGSSIQNFQYTFNIEETTNALPCASFQISGTPCDDRITFTSGFTSRNFLIGGKEYTLQLIGFSSTADGSSPISSLITEESQATSAFLVGRINTPPGKTTPEPAALVGFSMLGLYLFNQRGKVHKTNSQFAIRNSQLIEPPTLA